MINLKILIKLIGKLQQYFKNCSIISCMYVCTYLPIYLFLYDGCDVN